MRTKWCLTLLCAVLASSGCKKDAAKPARDAGPPKVRIGLVTDIGGRGDQSFNDSALRGLETWAAAKTYYGGHYTALDKATVDATLPPEIQELKLGIGALPVTPLVLQSKSQEDYEPNLQVLVDQGAKLTIGTGYLLEAAVHSAAVQNPEAKFLLIDSVLLDAKGKPMSLPNVRTVVFREEQGSFLAGALAGLVTQSGYVAFVGGMRVPLIQKFEAGFTAGVKTTNPKAEILYQYTGSFDNVATGKSVGADLVAKGADVVFHAAGADGQGVIQAVKEARAAGQKVWAIGVDSDQAHLAPDAVLTSMVKHVDLAVREATRDLTQNQFSSGDVALGLKEGGVALTPVTLDFKDKTAALAKVAELRRRVIAGEIKVPSTPGEAVDFKAAP